MKQLFKCSRCGDEFEIEADYFMAGISGQLVDGDGVMRTFVDPTEDHMCPACVYISLVESAREMGLLS